MSTLKITNVKAICTAPNGIRLWTIGGRSAEDVCAGGRSASEASPAAAPTTSAAAATRSRCLGAFDLIDRKLDAPGGGEDPGRSGLK